MPDFAAELTAEAMARQLQSEDFWQVLLAASKADSAVERRGRGRANRRTWPSTPSSSPRRSTTSITSTPSFTRKNREKKVFLLWMTDFFRRQLERTAGVLGIQIPDYM